MLNVLCPECDSNNVTCLNDTYQLYRCNTCTSRFSEEDIVDLRAAARRSKPRRRDDEDGNYYDDN